MGSTRIAPTPVDGVLGAAIRMATKRMLGSVPESLGVMWHHQPVLKATMRFSRTFRRWDACDRDLKSYAHMTVASLIGCSFCLDFGYFQAHNDGLDLDKAREIPRWRQSSAFTAVERDVLEYAEAMSQTPPRVTDAMSAKLLEELGAPALIELTTCIGIANQMARTNVALGIESDGLADSCGLSPMPARTAVGEP